ncbi:hypothetical protein Krac_7396 [Ktedonobacter racemifer DSM 44963]|uniref:Uncharacterized protein n=1 Tax=Ktedonobacter racemifer DSM 44963 TaxID=485913 RepID=D6TS48_KTERA|nr:hypothetical protein Krac_7396 [Ktedonobacter racemifer DSM 44963]
MSITSGYLPSKPPKKEERFIPGINDRGFLARFSVTAPWQKCEYVPDRNAVVLQE